MTEIKLLNPEALGRPLGQYSHMARVKASEYLFIAGQVAVDKTGNVAWVQEHDKARSNEDLLTALRKLG